MTKRSRRRVHAIGELGRFGASCDDFHEIKAQVARDEPGAWLSSAAWATVGVAAHAGN